MNGKFWKYVPQNLELEAEEDLRNFLRYLLAHPTPGSAGATGTWRTLKPVIHVDKCVKCGMCWLYCPENVITWRPGEYPSIDYTYCKGCGVCSSVCPRGAIEMVVEGE